MTIEPTRARTHTHRPTLPVSYVAPVPRSRLLGLRLYDVPVFSLLRSLLTLLPAYMMILRPSGSRQGIYDAACRQFGVAQDRPVGLILKGGIRLAEPPLVNVSFFIEPEKRRRTRWPFL